MFKCFDVDVMLGEIYWQRNNSGKNIWLFAAPPNNEAILKTLKCICHTIKLQDTIVA